MSDWRNGAACAPGTPHADLFHNIDNAGRVQDMSRAQQRNHRTDIAAARTVCAGCPVRNECLAFFLGLGSDDLYPGIAGGKTESERKQFRSVRGLLAEVAA